MINLLRVIVPAVCGSPALWHPEMCRENGITRNVVCPDTAIFDLWVEHPGTGWYEMCQHAEHSPDYDGVHRVWAAELEECWLSWDDSADSLAARLRSHESER